MNEKRGEGGNDDIPKTDIQVQHLYMGSFRNRKEKIEEKKVTKEIIPEKLPEPKTWSSTGQMPSPRNDIHSAI